MHEFIETGILADMRILPGNLLKKPSMVILKTLSGKRRFQTTRFFNGFQQSGRAELSRVIPGLSRNSVFQNAVGQEQFQ